MATGGRRRRGGVKECNGRQGFGGGGGGEGGELDGTCPVPSDAGEVEPGGACARRWRQAGPLIGREGVMGRQSCEFLGERARGWCNCRAAYFAERAG